MSKQITLSSIETYLNSILDNVVSKNVYFAKLPDASLVQSSDWTDLVLVDFPNGVKDFDAYGSGSVFVALYAKPFESGKKNVGKMSQLENALYSAIENGSNDRFHIIRNNIYSSYDEGINWHCNVVEILITIV